LRWRVRSADGVLKAVRADGRLTVRALNTPDHGPEHNAFALIDTAHAPEP
jgi:hypothetical protein